LDWLASDFMAGEWKLKRLHKLILTSTAYRQSSRRDPQQESRDPENRLYWRKPVQRLDAEAIRDSMLAIGGTLVVSSGGPALPLEYPENVSGINPGAVNPPAFSLKKMRPVQDFERTVYLPVIRSSGQPGSAKLRDVFDFTQPAQMSGKRAETAVATQALFLINSEMLRARAGELAKRVTEKNADTVARIEAIWLLVLNRPVSSGEREEAVAFVNSLPAETAWVELGHALLSSNEFLLRL